MGDVSSIYWHDSKIVCNCTHLESEHLLCGGCRHKNEKDIYDCDCSRYDQTLELQVNSEEYLNRLIKSALK